jgi:DNA polymerase-4
MQKPDGLTTITERDLPHALYPLHLDDLPGIGPRMLKRLNALGVTTVSQLCQLSESQMRDVWGGIVGQRWWYWLRGHDFPEAPTQRSTIGHSHVLPPELRTEQGARAVLIRMIHKVGDRLRRINYWAGQMEVYVSYTFREEGWSASIALGMCQDTQTMIEAFNSLWRWQPNCGRPTQVAVTLYDLVSNGSASSPLFPPEQRRLNLARTLDRLNSRFGPDTIYFGGMHGMASAAPTRIAFNQIPHCQKSG